MKTALVLVDLQNDFLPGGRLQVSNGDEVVPFVNQLLLEGAPDGTLWDVVVATQDAHPEGHQSFASSHPGKKPYDVIELHGLTQVLWPDHCIQMTGGAAFAPGLLTAKVDRIFPKGTDPTIDSYSGFFDNGQRKATGLGDYLRTGGVRDVYVMGLATDYCVKWTALDAVRLGFQVHLVEDGCRGVGLNAGDVPKAVDDMRAAGVRVTQSADVTRGG